MMLIKEYDVNIGVQEYGNIFHLELYPAQKDNEETTYTVDRDHGEFTSLNPFYNKVNNESLDPSVVIVKKYDVRRKSYTNNIKYTYAFLPPKAAASNIPHYSYHPFADIATLENYAYFQDALSVNIGIPLLESDFDKNREITGTPLAIFLGIDLLNELADVGFCIGVTPYISKNKGTINTDTKFECPWFFGISFNVSKFLKELK